MSTLLLMSLSILFNIESEGCFFCITSYNCTNGAKGVGYATTAAVVYSSIMVLLTNFLITALFFDL